MTYVMSYILETCVGIFFIFTFHLYCTLYYSYVVLVSTSCSSKKPSHIFFANFPLFFLLF